MNIEIGNKPIDFVFQGDELIYPNYLAKDNLVLHYDFSGRTNLDVKKGIAEDLSGNGNDGILENFAFESGSGYDSNSYLEFDNVDDFITIPELNLDVNDFTVLVDGQILSYRGDNVAKINENGLEIGGRNLLIQKEFILGEYFNHTDGIIVYSTAQARTSYIKVQPNTSYWLTSQREIRNVRIVQFDIDYNFVIGYVRGQSNPTPIQINTRANTSYIVVSGQNTSGGSIYFWKFEKGTIPTDWTLAPEDFQTTKITPFFSNKIKTLMYWNRALTDTELQEVYNVQKHRI